MRTFDVVIVGAGIIGLSTAYQLGRRGRCSVLVLEKGRAVGAGSTGASSAVCRFRYSRDDMVALALDGISTYRDWQAFTELKAPRASFNHDGVLWLTGEDREFAPREAERMSKLGIAAEVLYDDDLAERFPSFSRRVRMPDLETGEDHGDEAGGVHLFEPDGGWIDPVASAEDLLEAARNRGVTVEFGQQVTEIQREGGRVTGVKTASGEDISCPVVVNAAGPWCTQLSEAAGVSVSWDLVPTRIQVLYLDRGDSLPGHIPVTADVAGGIYFRTQNNGQQLVVGSVREEDEREAVADPDHFQTIHDDEFAYTQLHLLSHRLPGLPQHGRVRGYCGLYTVNRDDVHPVLGETELGGFWVANGFSGHGFKIAPAIGAMMADAIDGPLTGGADSFSTAVPLEAFGVGREPLILESRSVLA